MRTQRRGSWGIPRRSTTSPPARRSIRTHTHHVNATTGFCSLYPPQVNYFPSRFDPVRHAERYPIVSRPIGGRRERGE